LVAIGPLNAPGSEIILSALFVGDVLYAFTQDMQILTVDVTTGASTLVADYQLPGDFLGVAALAGPAVPEPASLVTLSVGLALGLASAALARRNDRRGSFLMPGHESPLSLI